jgi:phosphatidylserine/phosphatidylglycerophosphate/cardiolipin synthase-like enzyme
MKLIVQPDAGVAPVVTAIKQAKKTIDVLIFRLDRQEIIRALEDAVARGVAVRALIAHTNRGGQKGLRKLELRLLESGLTVTRTADDLVRYHGKMMVVDNRVLHVYGFNFTGLDIEKSRSFGVITRNQRLVQEALKLFEADCARQPYTPGCDRFVVSPENARERLTAFIKGARRELLIYDPKIGDPAILRLLVERQKAGVDIKIIGKLGGKKSGEAASRTGNHPRRPAQLRRQPEPAEAGAGEASRDRRHHSRRERRAADAGRVRAGLGAHRHRREGREESREGREEKRQRARPSDRGIRVAASDQWSVASGLCSAVWGLRQKSIVETR